ncbi:hypothetical protein GALMADRAFT_139222 [Galerina marginata CBS 339.88]|uniref:DHHA2 domain-containing protein n=1 Tax=Galerina marginata (strain CBS 339.88) TaxID=685588 RepID=A0A067T1Y6_GALM3|nr:hypothetical protein GALMADRAFT_139222 [Galerina marginata CBS 339.88]
MPQTQSPLRRLSVALGLTEAYKPADGTPTSPTPGNAGAATASLSAFLSSAKESFLKDVQEDRAKAAEKWTVVMGNEAGDLDTVASSIAFAWIQSEVYKIPAVPLIQVERADLALRAENLYALKLAGISDDQAELLTLTEIPNSEAASSSPASFPAHRFALVDHNRLNGIFTLNNPQARVVAVLDHHADEGLYPDAAPRTISPCGSCASHVGALFSSPPSSAPPTLEIPPELATLLLTAILIDTDGLKPGGKAVDLDRTTSLFLAPKTIPRLANSLPPPSALSPIDHPNPDPDALYDAQAIKDLTKALADKKADVSHLGAMDLLRRDYKEYNFVLGWADGRPVVKAGLSTVPARLKAWGADGMLEKDAAEWMQKRGLTVLGVLTSFSDVKKKNVLGISVGDGKKGKGKGKEKGKHKREMAWIVLEPPASEGEKDKLTADAIATRLWKGLEANTEIDPKVYKKFALKAARLPPGARFRVYKQGNAGATRKTTAPVLKEILEGAPEVAAGTEEGKKEGAAPAAAP